MSTNLLDNNTRPVFSLSHKTPHLYSIRFKHVKSSTSFNRRTIFAIKTFKKQFGRLRFSFDLQSYICNPYYINPTLWIEDRV